MFVNLSSGCAAYALTPLQFSGFGSGKSNETKRAHPLRSAPSSERLSLDLLNPLQEMRLVGRIVVLDVLDPLRRLERANGELPPRMVVAHARGDETHSLDVCAATANDILVAALRLPILRTLTLAIPSMGAVVLHHLGQDDPSGRIREDVRRCSGDFRCDLILVTADVTCADAHVRNLSAAVPLMP